MSAPRKIDKAAAQYQWQETDDELLELLKEHGTIRAVAKVLHVHPRTVSRYIRPRFEFYCEWRRLPKVIDAEVTAKR